jgi:hypothetical protein
MFDRSEPANTKMIHLIAGLYKAMNVNVVAYPELTAMLQPTDWDGD